MPEAYKAALGATNGPAISAYANQPPPCTSLANSAGPRMIEVTTEEDLLVGTPTPDMTLTVATIAIVTVIVKHSPNRAS